MLIKLKSFALFGINGFPVDIEVDTRAGIPAFDIVGLAGSGIKEARNRVRSAIVNSNYEFVPRRITVNLAPADVKKEGSYFDLAIAIAFLASTEQIPPEKALDFIFIGELSLDGGLRHVNGMMPMLISAYQCGYKKFIIPYENAAEACFIEGVEVYPAKNLCEVCSFLSGIANIERVEFTPYDKLKVQTSFSVDMSDIKGQSLAKKGVEIAVAGGHNILFNGAPGAGKTMLARCMPTIMPEMTFKEAVETTKVHSVAGIVDSKEGIVIKRPFRSPHHTMSLASLTGGGPYSMPGEVSLAHNGVLFLDELAEYDKKTLETLRQPLEDKQITVTRVLKTVEYPANFMLVASMNPCQCGNYGSSIKPCTCSLIERNRYKAKISGPLLDRIDIYVNVDGITFNDLRSKSNEEKSFDIKKRVESARKRQLERFAEDGIFTNSQMSTALVNKHCKLLPSAERLLERAFNTYKLSARGAIRILKIARTVADLEENQNITDDNLAEAIQYRVRDMAE